MKQFALLMAVVALATTGCAQNRVFGPHAQRGGADPQIARSQEMPRPSIQSAMSGAEASNIELAAYGGRCRCGDNQCCGDCAADCCCGDDCGGGCCDIGCGDTCCSSCDSGCGPCQRLAGRVASGFCPHSGGYPEAYNYMPSPPSGQVAYPYYTVRGPRDFLDRSPSSIGPY